MAALQDRYEFLGELDSGGFSTVYKARQLTTSQDVAIKVLRLPEEYSAEALEKRIARFRREMQLCAQMHHPNIVRLIDSGKIERDLYSVFEFVPGRNLAQILQEEGHLDPIEAHYFMAQTLDALACAHAQGVVHRDLKPANIMVVSTGARRNVLVLDFGIGTLTEEHQNSAQHRLTLTNEVLGTPAYAAPEQLRNEPPSPRSDLYSWGLVFLECLTGHRIVEGATLAEVLFKQLSPDPIRLPPMLKGHPLGRLLLRALAKDPAARDVTAKDLLHELEACDVRDLRPPPRPVGLPPSTPDGALATPKGMGAPLTPRGQRMAGGERRQITAVCCGMTVAGAGAQAIEAEEVEQILGALQEACAEIARQFGGGMTGMLGDVILFHFGFPAAREDDARRAARAALRMVREIQARNATLMEEGKVRVDVRIGMHTGMVVARGPTETTSSSPGLIIGATPKLAMRLSTLAKPGTILVSTETWRLVRGQFALEEDGERQVDGDTMERVYLLRERTPGTRAAEVALVGRTQEMQLLLAQWERVRAGTGQGVLITGEPGIGKSRLIRELGERVRAQGASWLECRCTPDGVNTPYFVIIDLLEQLLETESDTSAEKKVERLEALLSRVGVDLAEAMPLFTGLLSLPLPAQWSPLDVSPQKLRALMRDAVLSLLFELAEKVPLVLLIEDLHWADPSTVELLSQLAEEVSSAQVLAVFSARPEFTPVWPTSAVLSLQLSRLGRDEVERIAERISGGRELPDNVLEEVVARTDGVPLFVEEILQSMIETRVLVERNGRFELGRPLSEVHVPSTLRDSLMARLDRLERGKETAQVAATIGREFSLELVRAVSNQDAVTVQEDLDRLVAADLVHRKRRFKGPAYLFKHALVRDAAYDSMLKRSRQQVHNRIAQALVEYFPETVKDRPEVVAHHYASAEQMREAVRYAHLAAMASLQRGANREALAHAREALGWVSAIADVRGRAEAELDLNAIITPALMATQGFASPELERVLGRSRELIDVLGESEHVFPNLWALSTFHYVKGQVNESLELATRFLTLALKTEDLSRQVAARVAVGQCYYSLGRLKEAQTELREALRQYDPKAHRNQTFVYGIDGRIHALGYLAPALAAQGQANEAIALGEEAETWGKELRNHLITGSVLFGRCCTYHLLGMREQIPPVSDRMRKLVDDQGFSFFLPLIELFRAWAEGNLEAAQGLLQSFQASGGVSTIGLWTSLVVELLATRGRTKEALELLQGCIAHHDLASTYYLAEMLRLKGELLCSEDPAAAEASLREAVAKAREQGALLFELRASRALAELLMKQNKTEAARLSLEPVLNRFNPNDNSLPSEAMVAHALWTQLNASRST
jgi:TOMM system kinase/cyclase fusion protein